ncbi:MAG: Calx-beta domain-containing protein [Thiolinea sp.]
MKIKISYLLLYCGVFLLAAPDTKADQIVSPSTAHPFVAAGDTVNVSLEYQASAPETATESGLGLRIHYDSGQVTPVSIALYPAALQPYSDLNTDSEDFDNDPQTDRYFIVSWIDFDTQWPGAGKLPLPLANLDFTVNANLSGVTRIGFSASATAKNTAFQSVPLSLCPKPTLSVSNNLNTLTEGQTTFPPPRFIFQAEQTIPAVCGDLNINYTASGTASSGNDYTPLTGTITIPGGQSSAELMVNIIDDDLVETDETLLIALQNSTDYQLSSYTSSTLTIQSDDQTSALPEVNLSAAKLSVTEGQGGSLLIFAERTQSNLSQPLEVLIELEGTAGTEDYHDFPGSITIPAGKTRAYTILLLKDDAEQEADETLNINIVASDAYQRGANSSLQLVIQDDELNQNTSLPVIAGGTAQATHPASAIQKNHPIPTSSQWMLMLMSLLLSGLATLRLRPGKTGSQTKEAAK